MKNFIVIVMMALLLPCFGMAVSLDSLKYIDASEFQVLGKGFSDTQGLYDRLPAKLEKETRPPVWNLSKNCSGIAIRFWTNSTLIAAKWEVTGDVFMNHFTMTGIKGLDLYCLKDGKWQFVNSARPAGKATNTIIINHMAGIDSEYMLYLPLYDGLSSLQIGILPDALIEQPQIDSPKKGKPVVFYGTSITQGGCASRAGMSYPNQLSRMLDREIINLGFSGNGKLDYEIADAMADIDASCFVIDCLPNVSVDLMNEKYDHFIELIRAKKPDTPILLVETILFPHMYFDQKIYKLLQQKNETLTRIFQEQKAKGDKNIYYQKADDLIGKDQEATVDGVHLTDLGFKRMSEQFYPVIRKLIK